MFSASFRHGITTDTSGARDPGRRARRRGACRGECAHRLRIFWSPDSKSRAASVAFITPEKAESGARGACCEETMLARSASGLAYDTLRALTCTGMSSGARKESAGVARERRVGRALPGEPFRALQPAGAQTARPAADRSSRRSMRPLSRPRHGGRTAAPRRPRPPAARRCSRRPPERPEPSPRAPAGRSPRTATG